MSHISLVLTSKCNMNCNYCFEKARNSLLRPKDGTLICDSQLQSLIYSEATTSFSLTGGEPALYCGIESLVRSLRHKNVTILTNALERFRISSDLLKNVDIVVSLDGNEAVMKQNRNTDRQMFRSIMNNIEWYLAKAKTVTIHTVLTPFNINEEAYFPFEQFEEAANYKIAVPSMALTPEKFRIEPVNYGQAFNLIMMYEEKYNYHMNCSTNIISKQAFEMNSHSLVTEMMFLEYLIEKKCFRNFNSFYATIEEATSELVKKRKVIESALRDYLSDKPPEHLFDPYNFAESILYKLCLKEHPAHIEIQSNPG